jgi:hypothetical protein
MPVSELDLSFTDRSGNLLVFPKFRSEALKTLHVDIEHRCDVKREQLRNSEATHNRHSQGTPRFPART